MIEMPDDRDTLATDIPDCYLLFDNRECGTRDSKPTVPHPDSFVASAAAAMRLTLAELEALAGLLLSVLLPLDHTGIARDVTGLTKDRLQRLVDLQKGACNTVAHSTRLAGTSAAMDVDVNVETVGHINRLKRCHHLATIETVGEVDLHITSVDGNLSGPRS